MCLIKIIIVLIHLGLTLIQLEMVLMARDNAPVITIFDSSSDLEPGTQITAVNFDTDSILRKYKN